MSKTVVAASGPSLTVAGMNQGPSKLKDQPGSSSTKGSKGAGGAAARRKRLRANRGE